MKRTLFTLMFLATFGMAFAGPPVDYQLFCGEAPGTLVGVASLVEDEFHVMLIEGALELEECFDGVYGVADGVAEPVFTISFTGEAPLLEFDDLDYTVTYEEVPEVAVEGKLGAQQNRAMALERATQARERAAEHAGGPPMDVPGDDGEEDEVEADGEERGGPPADLPVPASPGRP